ncbi:hypothetical protein [Microbacterium luticocti]|uniref:hypothetical protein n=1 Tax=Microbacterium luticocti TaxID=451764 RepID=UPI000421435B|nr:hypothetical protein [Microbacterium luticocti]
MYDRSRFYGIDTQYTRDQSQRMDSHATELKGVVDSVSALVDQVLWIGPAADRFKQDWDGALRPELAQAADSLRENAAELRRRADLQDEVSNS